MKHGAPARFDYLTTCIVSIRVSKNYQVVYEDICWLIMRIIRVSKLSVKVRGLPVSQRTDTIYY